MRLTLKLIGAACALALCACAGRTDYIPVPEKETPSEVGSDDSSPFIEGELIAEFSEEMAQSIASGQADGLLAAAGVVKAERLYDDGGEWEERHRAAGLHRWYRLNYDPGTLPATKAAEEMASIPGVVYIEPSRKIRSTAYFNDPKADEQWALYNDGTKGSSYSAGADINVIPVWQNYTAGRKDVIVAVIDEGVELDHPDLVAAGIPGGSNGSKSFVYGYEGYKIPAGDHGTHVAGVIGAVNNNGIGISGIAGGRDGNGGVRILSCAIFRGDPADPKNTIQGDSYNAMVWAADHGAVIANNSWGHVYETEQEASEGKVGAIGTAIDYFIRYAGCDKDGNQLPDSPMKGGVVIFAAGNDMWKHGWPAEYEPVIAVGAMSSRFTRSYYSNYGDWVDIAAPGGDYQVGPAILSTVYGGGYANMQGTSMACPHVSGVAALIVSQFGGPGFTNEMLKERLLGGANRTALSPALRIGPLVDALGSMTYGGTEPPEKVEDYSVSVKSNFVTAGWAVTADPDDGKAFGYLFAACKDRQTLESSDPRKLPSSVICTTVETGSTAIGESISATLSGLDFDTDYYVQVVAYDYNGNYAEPSAIKQVRTEANNAPVVTTDYAGDYKVRPFEVLSVDYTVSDPDGHAFKIETETGSDALTFIIDGGAVKARIVGKNAPQGKYTARMTVTDAYNAVTVYPVNYEIMENHPPKVKQQVENIALASVGENRVLDMADYISDEDGESLTYSVVTSAQNIVHLHPSENQITMTALGFGMTDVTITAADAAGATCQIVFKVLVRDSSRPVDIFPNPVKTTLTVLPGGSGELEYRLSNKAGAVVRSGKATVSPFEPMSLDVSDLAAGTYYLYLKGAGLDGTYTIVKI